MRYWFRICLLCAVPFQETAEAQAQPPILNAANGDVTVIAASESPPGGSQTQPETPLPTKREQVAEELRVAQRTLDSAKLSSEDNNAKPEH
ncbi:MAG TPA: hypothetical protein VMM76_11320 [Pirellulaceae bacterium]|nr:hypothetical protein [Pirellulaceae bacterium]